MTLSVARPHSRPDSPPSRRPRALGLLAALLATAAALTACGGGDASTGGGAASTAPPATSVFQVGTTTVDPNLPPEPALPADTQVCSTLEAANTLVSRPDGSLPPEADPSTAGVGKAVSTATANPDQARIQAALDACGAAVDA
ncbi:endopolygalacturonase, partial [Burkholderia cenocepacia]